MTRFSAMLVPFCLIAACAGPTRTTTSTTVITATPEQPGPNPASQNCLTLGGTVVIQSGAAGQTGFCALPGGAVVEEWALYRETHP